jgi:2-oxoglutarate dehydrogenase E1 component
VPDLSFGDGDVKYHLGYSSQIDVDGKTIDLKLVPNPSHLEAVGPVVEGFTRAKADILFDSDYDRILPILIHGDAALAGQGVVYETVQMSNLDGYKTGGTIHFVINNQIGFTTDFEDARSSTYSTAAAALVQAPVFHINGDDPEAVVWATRLAVEYRQKFNSDVFIDMVCYRRHGHNEGDDPKFTQPQMYAQIESHPDPRAIYSKRLIDRGDVDAGLAEDMEKKFWDDLQNRLDLVKQKTLPYTYQKPEEAWRKLKKKTSPKDYIKSPETGISKELIAELLDHLATIPEGFEPLGKVNRLLKGMNKLLANDQINWGTAELMAYGSILVEDKDVRLSGQDVRRGTFSHRHAVFRDKNTYEEYNRLNTVKDHQGKFRIFNSLLSEFAVLGFEYGYALANPDALVIWEAQFGDFYNGAQTIVDQFITAGESKWRRMNGLVMLLPHGYEGQGPEHSSARLERFLQQCAEYNIAVANLSTPANLFHIFRRQLERPFRKPLVIMSPKSLLRHPMCVSSKADFEEGTAFQEIIDDAMASESKDQVKRLLMCSGKIYYDLHAHRIDEKIEDVAIMRVEQLYPLDTDALDVMMASYKKAEVYWVQEEPANMGAWSYMRLKLPFVDLKLISRKASASPATGFKKVHDENQKEIVAEAFNV